MTLNHPYKYRWELVLWLPPLLNSPQPPPWMLWAPLKLSALVDAATQATDPRNFKLAV